MKNRITFLDSPMNAITMTETVDIISSRIKRGVFMQHSVVNTAKLIHMKKDATLRKSVSECDLINIDGMGVVWGARFLGHHVPERVAGVDLFHELNFMAAENKFPVYYLGAEEKIVSKTAELMLSRHPALHIAGYHHGYFWDDEEALVAKIKASGAQMLFVAITSPKKENFINRWKDELGVDFVMGVGGTFDVIAGKVHRAPMWMQKSGLEWLYRVIQEPRRMWKRYLYTNLEFARLLLIEKLFKRSRVR